MIRLLFSSMMAIHGIIHLMGFAKEWDLGPDGRFSGKTLFPLSENIQKAAGILWLLACISLIAATMAYYSNKEWYWIPAGVGLILSQTLIIVYWHDAKWGTVVNVILLVVVIISVARFNFDKMVEQEVGSIMAASSKKRRLITNDMTAKLPPVVRAWLNRSHVVGKEFPRTVHIIQTGSMRTDATSKWMPFNAEQYFTIEKPAFVWSADIHANALFDIVGRDKYENGKGNMLIKVASLIPVANSSGKEVDQGTMVRYMAELIWFPQAALCEYLHWEQLDANHARITMNYGNASASGIYSFNAEGILTGFEAQRYGDFNGRYSKETWSVEIKAYRYFNGLPVASDCEITWKLKDGDFTWLKVTITQIEYI